MKKITTIVLLSILFGFLHISQSFACSCMMPGSPTKMMKESSIVMKAQVTDISQYWIKQGFWNNNEIQLNIYGYWKGNLDNKPLITQDSSAACGINFQKGKDYIIYADYNEASKTYSAHSCSRTTLIENAQQDIDELWDFISTSENDSAKNDKNKSYILYFLIWFFIAITLGFFIQKK